MHLQICLLCAAKNNQMSTLLSPQTWIIAFCSCLQHLWCYLFSGGELSKWLSVARRFSSAARIELMPEKHGQPSASPQICLIIIGRKIQNLYCKAQYCYTALDEHYVLRKYQILSNAFKTCVHSMGENLLPSQPPLKKLHQAALLLFIFGIQILSSLS